MNEKGHEILVKAALEGHKQVTGTLHWSPDRECAVGLLHLALHSSQEDARQCNDVYKGTKLIPGIRLDSVCYKRLLQEFDTNTKELDAMMELNDKMGYDFLTISRKLGDQTSTESS